MATNFNVIRHRLGLTQAEIAVPLGVTQSNISFYEGGQTIPPHVAAKLIAYAKARGVVLSFDDVYGSKPKRKAPRTTSGVA